MNSNFMYKNKNRKLTFFAIIITICVICVALASLGLDVKSIAEAEETANISTWDGTTIDTSWYNDTDVSFTITTAAQLAGLSSLSQNTENFCKDKTIVLESDIDLNRKEWTPIYDFYGIFDGNGKTIKNMLITGNKDNSGFFSTNSNVIKNLKFDSCEVHGKNDSGIVAGNGTIITKVSVSNSFIYGDYKIGGIVGFAYGDMDSCVVNNVTATAVSAEENEDSRYPTAGGIAGRALGGVFIKNCSVSESHISTGSNDAKSYSAYSSGIVAESGSSLSYGATKIYNCKVITTELLAINAKYPNCGVFNAAVTDFSYDSVPTMVGFNSTNIEETETIKHYGDTQEGAYSQIFIGGLVLDGVDYVNSVTTDETNKKTSFALPEDATNIEIGLSNDATITELKVAGQALTESQYTLENNILTFTVQEGYMQIDLVYIFGGQAYSLVLVKAAEGIYPELTYLVSSDSQNYVPITTYENTLYSDKNSSLLKGTGYTYKIRVGELMNGVTLTVGETLISSAGDYALESTQVSYLVTKDGLNTDTRTYTIYDGLIAYPNVENLYYALDTAPSWVYNDGQFESNFSTTPEPPTFEIDKISFYCIGKGTFSLGYEFKGYAFSIEQGSETLVEKYGEKDETTSKFNQVSDTLSVSVSAGYSRISVAYYDYDAANEKAYIRNIKFEPPLEIKFEYDGNKAEIRNVADSSQIFYSGDVFLIDEIKGKNFYAVGHTGKPSAFDSSFEASYIIKGFKFNDVYIAGSDDTLFGYDFTESGTISLIIEEQIPVYPTYSVRTTDEDGNTLTYSGQAEVFEKWGTWSYEYRTIQAGTYAVIPYGKTYSKIEFLIPSYGKNEKCFVIPKKYFDDGVLYDNTQVELTATDGNFVYMVENVSFDVTSSFFDFYYTAEGSTNSYYGVAGYRIVDESKTINDIVLEGKEYVEIINDIKYPYVYSSKAMTENNVVAFKSTNHDYDSSSSITFKVNREGTLYLDTVVEGDSWSGVSIAYSLVGENGVTEIKKISATSANKIATTKNILIPILKNHISNKGYAEIIVTFSKRARNYQSMEERAYIVGEDNVTVSGVKFIPISENTQAQLEIKNRGIIVDTIDAYDGIVIEKEVGQNYGLLYKIPYLGEGIDCYAYTDSDVANDGNVTATKIEDIAGKYYMFALENVAFSKKLYYYYQTTNAETAYRTPAYSLTFRIVKTGSTINDIVNNSSSTIALDNTSETPFLYDAKYSVQGHGTAYSTQSKLGYYANLGVTVEGTGVFSFWYYINSSSHDRLYTKINAKSSENDSGTEVASGYTDSKWTRQIIRVTEDMLIDGKCTIYIAYGKWGTSPEGEDILVVADLFFGSGEATVSFNTNDSNLGRDGITVTNVTTGGQVSHKGKVNIGDEVTLAFSKAGYIFYGWRNRDTNLIESVDPTYTFVCVGDVDYDAIIGSEQTGNYVARDGKNFYRSLAEALSDNSVERTVTLLADCTISENVVIPSNITLIMPYSQQDETGFAIGDTTNAGVKVSWNSGYVAFRTITIENGVTLTVNGKLIVGGVQHYPDQSAQGHTSGAYSQITNGGHIVVSNGGYLDVVGRVAGTGTITMNNGATLRQPFMVNNYAGGRNTEHLYNNQQFPFVQFATVNVECKQIINYGSKVIGATSLFFSGAITTQDIVLIDKIENNSGGEGSLIWMKEGSRIEISYSEKAIKENVGNIDLSDSGVTTIDVFGSIDAGEFYLVGYGSRDKILAIPYTYNFNLREGSIVDIVYGYKIMPGAVVTIDEGATLNISSSGTLHVYDGLIQSDKSGKLYPSATVLTKYEFCKSGRLINNGNLNILGIFTGVVGTTADTGIITAGNGAGLSATITDGSTGYYTDNQTIFTQTARIYTLNGFAVIEKGKTYKAFSADDFVLANFTVISAARVEKLSERLNQAMKGRFLEYDGSIYIADVTFTFPTELNGKIVVINGNNYEIVDGKVTVTGLTIGEDKKVTYRMSGIESEKISHEHVVTAGENTFDKLALSVALSESNVYEKVFVADGSVANDYVLKAVITYSDGTEVSYDLAFDAFTTYVKENAALTSEYISADVTLNHTLTVVKQALVAYIANAESLKTSANIVNDAKNVYAEYRTLTTGLSAEDLAFVNGKIGSLQNYADSIVTGIALKNGVVATYGDAETTANATMIDGSNKDVIVSLSGYAFASGDITAIATYAGNYTIDYAVTATFGGVSKKVVTLTVTGDGSYVYDGTEKAVAVTINGKVDGDNVTVNTIALIDVGTETVTFALSGDDNIFYLLSADTVSSATITITAKEVELVWTGNEFTYNGSEQKPEVRFADGRIVDGDDVSLSVTSQVNVGAYTATATLVGSKSANYSLKNPTFAYTIAQKPVTVRVADHNDVSENETSRILFTAVCEDDLGGYSFIITKDGVEVATVAADGKVTLKEGQTLSVGTYKVKAVSDNANYEVTSEENEFNIVEPNAYYTVDFGVSEDGKTYDGTATVFNVTAKVTDTNEVVNEIVVTITKDGIEVDSVVSAGRYTVTAKVGSDEVVYTKVFVVSKRTLTVAIDDINTVYGTPAEISYKITLGSIVNGDENVYSVAIDGAHANAGEYNIVGTVTDGNYAVTFISSKSADRNYGIYTVAKKKVTLVWTGSEFTYNGSKQSPEAKLAEGSVIGSDKLTVSVSAGNTNKGDYVATATLDGAAKGNYELTNATYSYVIKARSIKLNVADAESMYGNEVTFGVALVTPEDENELCGVSKNEIVRVACAVSKTSAAGTYDITLEVINENFIVNYEKGTYTVTKRGITVTVVAASSIYGEALATISGEVKEGSIVNGDENVYTLSKKGESLDEGKYEVVLTVNNDSYVAKIDNESVRYTIKPREITVKISDVGTTYGDNEASFVYSLNEGSSLGYNDSLDSVIRVSREAGNAAGKYAITAEGINHNYDVTFEYSDKANKRSYYYINKRGITLNVNDIEVDYKKSYEEVAEKFGYEIEGTLVGDDELTVTYAIYFGDRQATADNYATLVRGGTHTVKAVAVNANYEITVNDGVFTVTKPKITVKNVGTSFVYDDGKQIKAFDWQKNVEGFLASATESSVKATFRKIVDGTVENEPMGAITDAGTYRMTIVIVHTDAYVFDDAAVTEYDITVEKKDISSDIAVIGRSESGTYVQRRGIQIYANLNEYEDKDLTLNSTLTFNGEAVESPYEVGEYVFTATIDDANYCGESVYSFRIMASVAKKVSDLSALIEGYNAEGTSSERFDAIMAMREIAVSFTDDDLTQIADDAAYAEVVNQYVALYKNYLDDTKKDVEVAQKVASNVLFDMMAALTDIAVAFWFGKANRG